MNLLDHSRLVELLIERHANLNAVNKKRKTPLHIAAENGNLL